MPHNGFSVERKQSSLGGRCHLGLLQSTPGFKGLGKRLANAAGDFSETNIHIRKGAKSIWPVPQEWNNKVWVLAIGLPYDLLNILSS